MQQKISSQIFAFGFIVVMLSLAVLASLRLPHGIELPFLHDDHHDEFELEKFSSEEEFRSYLTTSLDYAQNSVVNIAPQMAREEAIGGDLQLSTANRVSETNVQVAGIDEPDIVKTNGQQIFYSNPQVFYLFDDMIDSSRPVDLPLELIAPDRLPVEQQRETSIINGFPPASMSLQSTIEEGGELLLEGNNLVVLSGNKLTGFNVADPTNPQNVWEYDLDSNSYIETARLLNGEIILVTRNYADSGSPCPMPLIENSLTIACTDIYRPSFPVYSDSIYTVLKINPSSGEVSDNVSFTGSQGSTVVYVTPDSVYLTYSYTEDPLEMYSEFFESQGDFLPSEYRQRISALEDYDISQQAKLVEYEQIISEYRMSLSEDERLTFEQETNNRLRDFAQGRMRDLDKTAIVKIDAGELTIENNAVVPGSPLNQFSLDEHNGNLRIATTVGRNSFIFPAESVNDLYILDGQLNQIGSIQNLAPGEQIFSARFMGDEGYLVTFEQIDPFFVLDLSNPSEPKVAGELKIPGFSSYLHLLNDNLVLGVGQEEGQVKLSLFDVSNPQSPLEASKYTMNEFWTEVQGNHHAFLQDDRHQSFFIPGGEGGYIFSYENNQISLVRSVAGTNFQRAIYIDDFMYIIGDGQVTVLNENDWSTVSTFTF